MGRSIGSHQRRWNAISSPPPHSIFHDLFALFDDAHHALAGVRPRLQAQETLGVNRRAIALRARAQVGGGLLSIQLHPFPAAQNPGHERVGQALRFCLSDFVIIKAVPARACTAKPAQASQFESYSIGSAFSLVSWLQLPIRSSLINRSAKSVASNALI
jgi:hypothetical protein